MSKLMFLLIVLIFKECRGTFLKGRRAVEGQFPWLVQFQTIAPCGGVLLAPDWVLTAAQCALDKRNSILLYATGLNGTKSGQTVNVKATYFFPRYEAYATIHDHDHNIALLKLAEPFDMCDSKISLLDIAPIRYDDDYYQSCLIFGWQSYVAPSFKVLAKPIQYSEVILSVWKFCTHMHKVNASYANVFCTMIESENGLKACGGNPGSPVVCTDQYQRTFLIGVASWTNYSLDCGDLPTYLSVSPFRTWMYELITSRDIEPVLGACMNRRNENNRDANKLGNYLSGGFPRNDGYTVSQRSRKEPSGDSTVRLKPIYGEYDAPVFDIANGRRNYLKQYHEIGRDRDEVVASAAEHGNFNFLAKYSTETLDDFELIMPFGFEDSNNSYSPDSSVQFLCFFIALLYVIF